MDRASGHTPRQVFRFFVFHVKFTDTPIGKNADPPPHTHAVGGRPCCPQPTATTSVVWSWRLKGCKSALAVKGTSKTTFGSCRGPTAMPCDESTRTKQLSMAATARVIWLCACVRYCRPRGWCLSVSLAFSCFYLSQPLSISIMYTH